MVTWDLWIDDVGSTGISFARGALDPTPVLWVHSAPVKLNVEVRDQAGAVIGRGHALERTRGGPMSRLVLEAGDVRREDAWPDAQAVGQPVILPGGEVGIILEWWNNAERTEWRWRVEFYNRVQQA